MKKSSIDYPFAFSLGIIFVLWGIVFLIWGFNYEEYQGFFPAAFSGSLTDGIPCNIATFIYLGFGSLVVKLYELQPSISWYDWLMNFLQILASSILLKCFIELPRLSKFYWKIPFSVLFFGIFCLDGFIQQNYTRTAFMLCAAAYVNLLGINSKHWLSAFLMLIATSIRYEAGILGAAVGSLFLLFFLETFRGKLIGLVTLILPVFIIIIYLKVEKQRHSGEFLYQLKPSTEYKIALGNTVPITTMQSVEDSMKFIAFKNGILNDEIVLTFDFMENMVKVKSSSNEFEKWRWVRAYEEIVSCIRLYKGLSILGVSLLFFLFSLPQIDLNRKLLWFYFTSIFIVILYVISFNMSMENRIFQPMISIFIVLIIYNLLSNEAISISRIISKLIVLILLPLAIFISYFDFIDISNNYQLRSHRNRILNAEIRDAARDKILVPDYFVFNPMFFYSNRPFEQFEFKSFKNVFMLDIETYSLTPDYVTYLNKHCNCNSKDLASFFDYLFSIKGQVLIAGNERRIRVFENYLKLVRKRRYHFVKTKQIEGSELTQNEPIGFYRIE